MNRLRTLFAGAALLLGVALLATSCKKSTDDVNNYQGAQQLFATFGNGTAATEVGTNQTADIPVTIRLTQRSESATVLRLALSGDGAQYLTVPAEVSIPAGTLEYTLNLSLKKDEQGTPKSSALTAEARATLTITSSTAGVSIASSPLTITFSPLPVWTPTAAQQQLIAGYKAKGIDLSNILGYHIVSGTVDFAGFTDYDHGLNGQPQRAETMQIDAAMMLVELSDKATADVPVFRLSYNALGLNSIFQRLWYIYTVGDQYFFDNADNPGARNFMAAMNWSLTSPEKFNTTLDNIRLVNGKLEFLGKMNESVPKSFFLYEYLADDDKIIVPFVFESSVLDRVPALLDSNAEIKENYPIGQMNIYSILFNSGIDTDQVKSDGVPDSHYVTPEATIDLAKGTFSFTFPFYTEGSDYYSVVKVTTQHR